MNERRKKWTWHSWLAAAAGAIAFAVSLELYVSLRGGWPQALAAGLAFMIAGLATKTAEIFSKPATPRGQGNE